MCNFRRAGIVVAAIAVLLTLLWYSQTILLPIEVSGGDANPGDLRLVEIVDATRATGSSSPALVDPAGSTATPRPAPPPPPPTPPPLAGGGSGASPQLTFWLSDLHDGTRADLTSMLTAGLGQRVIMAGSRKSFKEYPDIVEGPDVRFASHYPWIYNHPLVSFPKRPLPLSLADMAAGRPPSEAAVRALYEHFRDDPDMASVDVFVCTFPMAFCEAYLPFNRHIIWMPAHRYAMGRCSEADRTRLDVHLEGAVTRGDTFAAMSVYDAEYMFYYTGIRPTVLTSSSLWYAGHDAFPWAPTRPEILLGPLRASASEPAELTAAAGGRYSFVGVRNRYKIFTLGDVAQHRALVLLPYAVMSYGITEVYALGVPIFVPSRAFLTASRHVNDRGLMIGNAYCPPREGYTPNRHAAAKAHRFSPEMDDPKSLGYWLQFADYFQWPHITPFDNYTHLVALLDTADFHALHSAMVAENARREAGLVQGWRAVIQRAHDSNARRGVPRAPLPETYAAAVATVPGGFPSIMAPP